MDLHGKVAIVTGASRGIGKQVAIELGRRGATVVIAARTVDPHRSLPGTIGETVAAIEAVGATALAVRADMGVAADLELLVATTLERFGRVDILVNNAAATGTKSWGSPMLELTREQWMAQYDVNLHAPYTLMRAVAPSMAANGGGRIVNLTTAGHQTEESNPSGLATPLAYPSSKAALDQLCRSVAPQLKAMGIMVANIHPGFVHTELTGILGAKGVDISESIPMDIPTRAIAHLITCDDPMRYAGKVLVAETLVAELDK